MSARSLPQSSPILSAGVIPIYAGKRPEFLLLRVYRYWDFPKGMVEISEDPFRAAMRELTEETGIEKVVFPWGDKFYETEAYAHGKVARYYLGQVDQREVSLAPNPVTGLVEHHEYRWFTAEEARRVLVPRVEAALDWALGRLDRVSQSQARDRLLQSPR